MPWQSSCIIPSCKSRPRTMCAGCTRDVEGIVFVCKPSNNKRCWEILHQVRSPNPVDAQGNLIERPQLNRKRKRNSSFGVRKLSKRKRKSLSLNPHHSELNWHKFQWMFEYLVIRKSDVKPIQTWFIRITSISKKVYKMNYNSFLKIKNISSSKLIRLYEYISGNNFSLPTCLCIVLKRNLNLIEINSFNSADSPPWSPTIRQNFDRNQSELLEKDNITYIINFFTETHLWAIKG